jgi:hypothetical protein
MKSSIGPLVRRILLSSLLLTLLSCRGQDLTTETQAKGDSTGAARSAPNTAVQAAIADTSDYARHKAARLLAERQYERILDWLDHEGLRGTSHDELVSLAQTDDAAAKYIRCDEDTRTPSDTDSRLGSLAACLMRDTKNADSSETTETRDAVVADRR